MSREIKVGDVRIAIVNCKSWGLKGVVPRCSKGLNPSVSFCETCSLQEERQALPPVPPRPSFPQQVVKWVTAEVSVAASGYVSDGLWERRMETCNGCEQLERASDPSLLGWCKACGCGKNKRAELTVKGRMPKATCPLKAWENDSALRVSLPDTLNR
jgi:hypothetical protein